MIDQLFAALEQGKADLEGQIRAALRQYYDDWGALQAEIARAESHADGYRFDECGDVEAWINSDILENIPEREREYLSEYLGDYGLRADWSQDMLLRSEGADNYLIQTDTRHNNGVWQNGKLLFDADDCTVDGEWSDEKAAWLIERHMQQTGYFPGVFDVTRDGDVYPVETQKLAAAYVPTTDVD